MKLSRQWLTEAIGREVELESMLERLTLAGLEVDGVQTLEAADGVVIGKVTAIEQHPDADKLRVCQVFDGNETLSIVCGAPNARADMTVAVARIGAMLPGGMKIRRTKLRGVQSFGMLCSAAELGLGDDHDGILDLPSSLEAGTPLADALGLPDAVIDIDLTPNRGDCFSLLGVAREVATFSALEFTEPSADAVSVTIDDRQQVVIGEPASVPAFTARVIRGINATAKTPLWMRERLRRSGIRSIHPVVDVTNYVMLEYGQPLHGYDLDKLDGAINVRNATGSESLTLLDGRTITPAQDTLLITDDSGPIGLAGVMGGESTMVDDATTNIVFEAAFFSQAALAGQARRYNMHTDASMRFERGVDPVSQQRAQQRAAQLLIDIAGGQAGEVVEVRAPDHVPACQPVVLRAARLRKILGADIPAEQVIDIFSRLGFSIENTKQGWSIVAPSWRFDISIEEDLVEEVARVYGYDRIPQTRAYCETALAPITEQVVSEERLRDTLAARGFSEAITYSFVDPDAHNALQLAPPGPMLVNPISRELSLMRGTLLCGLLQAGTRNLARQQPRVRLFEIGHVFEDSAERQKIAGIVVGARYPEQWAISDAGADFFDIKSALEALLSLTSDELSFSFRSVQLPALHPGQAAEVLRGDQVVGVIGALHPRLASTLDISQPCFVFEVDIMSSFAANIAVSQGISRFPQVRRDIAILLDENVPANAIVETARSAGGELLKAVRVFDVYRGKGVEPGRKSVALGLILLDSSRTLTDEVSDDVVAKVIAELHRNHGAKLRE